MGAEIITFIVPAYNAEATLTRTIDSIVNQSDNRYKIIIVNDGSSDKTEVIGKSYQNKYPEKIKYIYQDNKGPGGARNQGIESADTEYITFLDSDDWLVPYYVEKLAGMLDQIMSDEIDRKPEIIMTLPQIYDEKSIKITDWYDKELFKELFPVDGACINPQIEPRIYRFDVSQCRNILHLGFVRKINFQFREKVRWEDVFPHFYLLSNCSLCMGIGSIGFYYRKGNSNQFTASRGSDRMDLLTVYEDLLEYLFSTDIGKKHIQELKYPVMRIMVSFANEGIRMANIDTREKLVNALYCFFRRVPKSFDKALYTKGKKYCTKTELRQYKIFLAVIRRKWLLPVFYDYLYRDASEQLLKRALRKIK